MCGGQGARGLREGRATNESVLAAAAAAAAATASPSSRHRIPENGPAASIPKHLPEGDFCLRDLQRLLLGARSRELCPKARLLGLLGPGHVDSEAQFVSLLTR